MNNPNRWEGSIARESVDYSANDKATQLVGMDDDPSRMVNNDGRYIVAEVDNQWRRGFPMTRWRWKQSDEDRDDLPRHRGKSYKPQASSSSSSSPSSFSSFSPFPLVRVLVLLLSSIDRLVHRPRKKVPADTFFLQGLLFFVWASIRGRSRSE